VRSSRFLVAGYGIAQKFLVKNGLLDSDTKPPVFALVAQFTAFLLLATVVGITATSNALFTAIIAILAVAIFVAASSGFVNKSGAAIIIEVVYIVIAGVIMIAAQGLL